MNDRQSKNFVAIFLASLTVGLIQHSAIGQQDLKQYDHRDLSTYIDPSSKTHPIKTLADWQKRRGDILAGMQAAMGPLPDRSELPEFELNVLNEKKFDGFTRQDITFVVEGGDRLPAHLYLPTQTRDRKKFPAVLALHPTGREGKRIIAGEGVKANREYAHELAERGYVVIAPDYPSFGDYQYDFANDEYASGAMKGIFNHIRCVDLLCSFDFVDSERIGVVGHSLGGHNALFAAVFDERLKAVATSCGWTPFHDYYKGDIKGWTSDRYMPRLRDTFKLDPNRVPFDFQEVLAAIAPRAVFSSSPLHDSNFEVEGVRRATAEAKKIFEMHDMADNLQVVYPDCDHDFPPEIREQTYQFFDKVLTHKPATIAETASNSWKVGVGKSTITPKEKIWMSGYASRDHPAEGTLHNLWAKTVVIEDANRERLALVSLDLVGINRKLSLRIKARLKDKFGIGQEQIALMTSHTHTGPVIGENLATMYHLLNQKQIAAIERYTDSVVESIVSSVGEAIDDLEPVRLRTGIDKATFAVNRRNNVEANVPTLRAEKKLKGPHDHEVPVLVATDSRGSHKAIVFGYACHATTLSFYQWSGDWPGFAQIEIEKRYPEATAIFWAGCGADQNPLPRRTVELAQNYGNQIADAVDRSITGEMQEVTGQTNAAYSETDLEFAELPNKTQIESDATSANKYVASRAKHLLSQIERDGELSKTYPYPIQFWRIGNEVAFVILGGEVVVDYSIRLKYELSNALDANTNIWVAGYANDVMAYIPSKRVLLEGGYEGVGAMVYYGLPTAWSPRVEMQIVDEVNLLSGRLSGSTANQ